MGNLTTEMLDRCAYEKVPKGEFELRMYYFTIYQLAGMQGGIQSGHSGLRYARKYGNDPQYLDFIDNWETSIVLNGGTTNWRFVDNMYVGDINNIASVLHYANIKYMLFLEPDLNEALSAVCFLVDERVFNKEKYPDFDDWFDPEADKNAKLLEWHNTFDKYHDSEFIHNLFNEWYSGDLQRAKRYDEWVDMIGGEKNVILRELLKDKRLA